MSDSGVSSAIPAWQAVIGAEHVLASPAQLAEYTANVSGLRRAITAVLRPSCTAEVQRIVEIANVHRTPLYPISCGKNWGMGSKLPVRDGQAIVDLRRMNRIRELNTEHHYAVVEPGVTQLQLHERLKGCSPPMLFNVTGSGLHTSLIGNALERGVGYFASRADDLSGLEVVLGNGRVITTGNGHFAGSVTTHIYRYGLGPSLDGLFAQSNFGIVTAAGVELMPQRGTPTAMLARLTDPARFAPFMQALTDLRKREVLQTAIHIGNRNRIVSTLGPLVSEQLGRLPPGKSAREVTDALIATEGTGAWSAVGGLHGSFAEQFAARREVRRALRGLARVMFVNEDLLNFAKWLAGKLSAVPIMRRKYIMAKASAPMFALARGIPTDQSLKSTYWLVGDDAPAGEMELDLSRSGFLYCLPIVPMSGRDAQAAADATETIFRKRGFEAFITFNMLNSKALEGVINLVFDRTVPERVEAALLCIEELQQRFVEFGYTPYRLGVQSMAEFIDARDPFWQTVNDLKQVLDPNDIIAPGRYNTR